jgi:hypothetical protein
MSIYICLFSQYFDIKLKTVSEDLKKLLRRHCNGEIINPVKLYKAAKQEDNELNKKILLKLISHRIPTRKLSLNELETALVTLENKGAFKAMESDMSEYKLPNKLCSNHIKSYLKGNGTLHSLIEKLIENSIPEERQMIESIARQYLIRYLMSRGYKIKRILKNVPIFNWDKTNESVERVVINWNNKNQVIDAWKDEYLIINTDESIINLQDPDNPLIPSNSRIMFKLDTIGTYEFTEFNKSRNVLKIEIYDKKQIMDYIPKMSIPYTSKLLHSLRKWIEVDNCMRSIEINMFKSNINKRSSIISSICKYPSKNDLQKTIMKKLLHSAIEDRSMDSICRIVIKKWIQQRDKVDDIVTTCIIDGNVDFDRVVSIMRQDLIYNNLARKKLETSIRSL